MTTTFFKVFDNWYPNILNSSWTKSRQQTTDIFSDNKIIPVANDAAISSGRYKPS